jgi:hypothetical protein
MTSEKGEIVRRGQRRVGAVEAGPWQLERLGSKAELRSLTNGPPSRTNVCTRRAPHLRHLVNFELKCNPVFF